MKKRIADDSRTDWLDEEYAKLNDPSTYVTAPQQAWKRLKIRNMRAPALHRLMHLAAWRETEAQQHNLPRNRVLRDETLIDLWYNPKTLDDFSAIRNFPGGKDGKLAPPILKILHNVAECRQRFASAAIACACEKPPAAIMELLRVLLKHVTDEQNIAPRLIASADDLELLAR